MGEFANYAGQKIKIGTCDEMLYLRYEDRHLVEWIKGNVDAASDMGLKWRLPFSDEDDSGPGRYADPFRAVQLRRGNEWFRCPEAAEQGGTIQMTHPCGYLLNVPCYHGEKLPGEGKPHGIQWNGRAGGFYELVHVKNTAEGVLPVIRCRFCREAWRAEWAEVLEWIPCPIMRERLARHAAELATVA
jgi:hypothetical protein